MSMIRRTNTSPELKLKRILRGLGFVYQPKGIYGKPDFVNLKQKIAIFVDGCFWHGCPKHYNKPETNRRFWVSKITKNIERDKKVTATLKGQGFRVIRVWEHDIVV